MPEELYTSRDFCELAEQFEELKRENEELVSDKMHLINAAMDGVDKYRYTAHDIAYRDLERKCEALEADYVISNRELLIKQVEINRQSARIAELEAEVTELKPYRDGYDAYEDFPEEGENVIANLGSWLFLAQRRGDKWYDSLGQQAEIRGGVERWWKLPEVTE